MIIYSHFKLSQDQQTQLEKEVLKKVKPNCATLSNIKIKIPGLEITGNYMFSRDKTFTVLKVEEINGTVPKPKKVEKSSKKSTKAEQRKKLMDLKKVELIKLCEKHKIKYEKDNNKSTLVDLLMLNGKSE